MILNKNTGDDLAIAFQKIMKENSSNYAAHKTAAKKGDMENDAHCAADDAKDGHGHMADDAKDGHGDMADDAKDGHGDMADDAKDGHGDMTDDALDNMLMDDMMDGHSSMMDDMMDGHSSMMDDMMDGHSSMMDDMMDGHSSMMDDMMDGHSSMMDDMMDGDMAYDAMDGDMAYDAMDGHSSMMDDMMDKYSSNKKLMQGLGKIAGSLRRKGEHFAADVVESTALSIRNDIVKQASQKKVSAQKKQYVVSELDKMASRLSSKGKRTAAVEVIKTAKRILKS